MPPDVPDRGSLDFMAWTQVHLTAPPETIRWLNGETAREIGADMGVRPKTINMRVSRGLRRALA